MARRVDDLHRTLQFGLDKASGADTGRVDHEFGQQAHTHPIGNHAQNPVFPLARERIGQIQPAGMNLIEKHLAELAMQPVDITLASQLFERDLLGHIETMLRPEGDYHPLPLEHARRQV